MKTTLKTKQLTTRWAASLVICANAVACTTDDDPFDDALPGDDPADDAGNGSDSGLPEQDASLPEVDAGDDPDDAGLIIDADLPDAWLDGGVVVPPDARAFDADILPIDSGEPAESSFDLMFDFTENDHGWEAGFADFFPDMEDGMDLIGGFQPSDDNPPGVGAAFTLQGSNHSDDLFMFMKKRLSSSDGILADRTYRLSFSVVFHSDAPSNCVGIGGAPGESVYLKAGGSSIEPEAELVGDAGLAQLRMNIDKGNQASGGEAAEVIGNIANGIDCEQMPTGHVEVERSHEMNQLVNSSTDSELWVFVGTDSGFEGRTDLYVSSIRVEGVIDFDVPE